MTATMTNGRARKSLADQIDRLDSMLDGLANGLNEAVAEAVKQTVRAVLTEVFSNPELLARIQAAQGIAAPVAVAQPSSGMLTRAWDGIRAGLRKVGQQLGVCRAIVGRACGVVSEKANEAGRRVKSKALRLLVVGAYHLLRVRRFIGPVLSATALAGLTATAGIYLGPWIAAGVSGIGGLGVAMGAPSGKSFARWAWPWSVQAD